MSSSISQSTGRISVTTNSKPAAQQGSLFVKKPGLLLAGLAVIAGAGLLKSVFAETMRFASND